MVTNIDVDECNVGFHDCDKTGFSICTNNNGSYECSCHAGNFSGSGTMSNPCIGKYVFHMRNWNKNSVEQKAYVA